MKKVAMKLVFLLLVSLPAVAQTGTLFGMFYDRFGLANTLTAERYNRIVQQQYVVANPDFFPTVPALSSLSGPLPASTIHVVSSTLRAPYIMQSAVGFERQLPFGTTVALTWANSHGLHLLRSGAINAPFLGQFPLGRPAPVFLMESSGLYNQNQLIVNVNSRVNRNLSLTGSYVYNRANSNTGGLGTFPANPYSMEGSTDPRPPTCIIGSLSPARVPPCGASASIRS